LKRGPYKRKGTSEYSGEGSVPKDDPEGTTYPIDDQPMLDTTYTDEKHSSTPYRDLSPQLITPPSTTQRSTNTTRKTNTTKRVAPVKVAAAQRKSSRRSSSKSASGVPTPARETGEADTTSENSSSDFSKLLFLSQLCSEVLVTKDEPTGVSRLSPALIPTAAPPATGTFTEIQNRNPPINPPLANGDSLSTSTLQTEEDSQTTCTAPPSPAAAGIEEQDGELDTAVLDTN
ncbi:hypothetical protein HDV05_002782, partial [Chytridiales sp. JEL 0842]